MERDAFRNDLARVMVDDDGDDGSDEESDDETWFGIDWRDDLNANFVSHYDHRHIRDILEARQASLQINSRFMDARHLIVLRRLEAALDRITPGPLQRAGSSSSSLRYTTGITVRSLHEFASWLTEGAGFTWPHDIETNCQLRVDAAFTRHIAQIGSAVRRAIWPAPPIHPSLLRVEGNWPGITWFMQDQLSVFVPADWNLVCLDCNGYHAFVFRTLYMRYRDPRHRSFMCVNCHSIKVVGGGAHHEPRAVELRYRSHSSDISQFHRALSVHSTKEGYANSESSDSSWCSDEEKDDISMQNMADDSLLRITDHSHFRRLAAWKSATSAEDDRVIRERRDEQFTFYGNKFYSDGTEDGVSCQKHVALRHQIYMLMLAWRHGQEPSFRMCIDALDAAGNMFPGSPSRFMQLVLPFIAPVIEGMFRCMHCLSLNGPTLPAVHHYWCPCHGTGMRGVPEIVGPDDYASMWWGVGVTHIRQQIATIETRLALMRSVNSACKYYCGDVDFVMTPSRKAEHRAMLGGRSTFPVPPETFNIRDRRDAAPIIGRIPSLGNAFIIAANDIMFDVHATSKLARFPARQDPRATSLVSFASALTPPRLAIRPSGAAPTQHSSRGGW